MLYLWETNPAPTEQKAVSAQEPAWMFATMRNLMPLPGFSSWTNHPVA